MMIETWAMLIIAYFAIGLGVDCVGRRATEFYGKEYTAASFWLLTVGWLPVLIYCIFSEMPDEPK